MEQLIADYTELVKAYCSCPSDATIEAIEAFEAAHPELLETAFANVFMNVSGGKFD